MSSLLKFSYNVDGKRINGYLKCSSAAYSDIKAKIDASLFEEHQQKRCEIRVYWIDQDADEIDIVNQSDYNIFLHECSERRHLLVVPKKAAAAASNEEPATKTQDASAATATAAAQPQVPPADVSNDANSSIHPNVECDSCLMAPIVGFRYKCIQCPNFDLCQHCEAKHVHADHMMVRMPNNSCPYVVDAWVSGGGFGRKSGRKHEKRCKNGESGRTPYGFTFPAAATAAATAGTEAEKTKECGGRRHGRRHARHSFLSHLYEMMHDLAEGGGAAAAAAASGTTEAAGTGNTTSSTTTTTTTSTSGGEEVNHEAVAKAAADAAHAAAQNAHEVAVQTAEIAAKVAHQTALAAAAKAVSENMAATTSAAASNAAAEASNEKKADATTSPQAPQPTASAGGPMSGSPSLQDFVHLLDPKLLRGGMEILSNFNDMFAKMLDPMDGAEGGDSAPSSCPFATNTRRNSTVSQQSNNSKKSNDSTNSNKSNNSTPKSETKQDGDKKQQAAINSLLDISDLGSDSESDSVSESFIKVNAPAPEAAAAAAANVTGTAVPSTPTTSQSSTPPQSLNKSNVMDFAQLSADLKAHIAQEETQKSTTAEAVPEVAKAAVEMRAVPVFNTPTPTENATAVQPQKPEDKRAVPVYHADQRINHSVHAMMSMGFSNEGAWLTQLLESVNGNIPEALDLISATQRNSR